MTEGAKCECEGRRGRYRSTWACQRKPKRSAESAHRWAGAQRVRPTVERRCRLGVSILIAHQQNRYMGTIMNRFKR